MISPEYFVSHGRTAFLGRFANRTDVAFAHGDRVVVKSDRGIEAGTVLGDAPPTFSHLVGPELSGELLRKFAADDESRETRNRLLAEEILLAALEIARASHLPVAVLDAEVTLDRNQAYLEVVFESNLDLSQLCESLSERFTLKVSVVNLPPVAPDQEHGCGKPDCGQGSGGCTSCGSGGCSTGGCSRGQAKSADELTAYFASLRRQMEASFGRVPVHG
jgi:cell fate regulator YaaT (PSP1 superfamily)